MLKKDSFSCAFASFPSYFITLYFPANPRYNKDIKSNSCLLLSGSDKQLKIENGKLKMNVCAQRTD